MVGGAEVGAQAPVVAGDDDAAAARLLLGVDAVLDAQAGGLDGVVQDGRVLVVAGAAEVDDAVGGSMYWAPRAEFWAAPPAMSLAS